MTTEYKPTYSPEGVAWVSGRWAKLENGELVTAIPDFRSIGREDIFDLMVAEFHYDPDRYLDSHDRVQTIPPWRSSRGL